MSTQQTEAREPRPQGRAGGAQKVRSDVLAAARRMFAERGIHAVSVRDIAKEVGVSHTLLHLYFGSKDEIVRQVLSAYSGPIDQEISAAGESSASVAASFERAAADPDYVRVLAAALLEGAVPEHLADDLETPLAFHRAVGDTKTVDPKVVGMLLGATVIGWAVSSQWLREVVGKTDGSDEEVARQAGAILEQWVRDTK